MPNTYEERVPRHQIRHQEPLYGQPAQQPLTSQRRVRFSGQLTERSHEPHPNTTDQEMHDYGYPHEQQHMQAGTHSQRDYAADVSLRQTPHHEAQALFISSNENSETDESVSNQSPPLRGENAFHLYDEHSPQNDGGDPVQGQTGFNQQASRPALHKVDVDAADVSRDQDDNSDAEPSEFDRVLSHIDDALATSKGYMKESSEAQLSDALSCAVAAARIRTQQNRQAKTLESLDYLRDLVVNRWKSAKEVESQGRRALKDARKLDWTASFKQIERQLSEIKLTEQSQVEIKHLTHQNHQLEQQIGQLEAQNKQLAEEKQRLWTLVKTNMDLTTETARGRKELSQFTKSSALPQTIQAPPARAFTIRDHGGCSSGPHNLQTIGREDFAHLRTPLREMSFNGARTPVLSTSEQGDQSAQRTRLVSPPSFSLTKKRDRSASPPPPALGFGTSLSQPAHSSPWLSSGTNPATDTTTPVSAQPLQSRQHDGRYHQTNSAAYEWPSSTRAKAEKVRKVSASSIVEPHEAPAQEVLTLQEVLSHFDIRDPTNGQRAPAMSMDPGLLTALTPPFRRLQTREALDAFIAPPRKGVRCAQEHREKAVSKTSMTKLPEDQSDACLHCIDKGLLCVLVTKGKRPLIMPLPAEHRSGAQPHEAAFWFYQESTLPSSRDPSQRMDTRQGGAAV